MEIKHTSRQLFTGIEKQKPLLIYPTTPNMLIITGPPETRAILLLLQWTSKITDGVRKVLKYIVLEMQFLPEAPIQCCLVLPGAACNGASTDAALIVSPYNS